MKLALIYSKSYKALSLVDTFNKRYDFVDTELCDVIVVLGGDGFMLHCIHKYQHLNKPIYGINCGTLGFLLNNYNLQDDLFEKISQATTISLHPLEAIFVNSVGEKNTSIAFNEVSFLRSDPVASHLKIDIDGNMMMNNLVSDGLLVSTPMGSTAYNRACGGNVVSVDSNLLVMTPINPFNPLNWKGATIKNKHIINITNLDIKKRKINLFCDYKEFKNISKATISLSEANINLLFNPQEDLEHKILQTQFNK